MESQGMIQATDPQAEQGQSRRRLAGKALAIFLVVMVLLTWANKALEAMTIATVKGMNVQRGALEKIISGNATLKAGASVPVIPEDDARVLEVYVQAGSPVEKGDPLFSLDYRDVLAAKQDAMDAAQDALDQAGQALDWAAADLPQTTVERLPQRLEQLQTLLERYEQRSEEYALALENDNDPSLESKKQVMEQAQYAYEAEKRRLDSDTAIRDYLSKWQALEKAQNELDAAQVKLDTVLGALDADAENPIRTYTSPVNGVVTDCQLTKGSMAGTGSPAITLSDQAGGTGLTMLVSEEDAKQLAIGDTAEIGIGSDLYNAQIRSISPSIEQEGYVEVSFQLPGDAGTVGLNATVRIRKRTQNYDAIVQLGALHTDDSGDYVYVIEQQESSLGARMQVRRVNVQVLEKDGQRAAVQGGISQRDVVAARSDRALQDGDRVRLSED